MKKKVSKKYKKINAFLTIVTVLLGTAIIAISCIHKKQNDDNEEIYTEIKGMITPTIDEETGEEEMYIPWEELNENVVGWLYVDEYINYPIMQADNNSYYLYKAYDGSRNYNGSIFMSYHNKSDFTDQNTIIYGHNMSIRSTVMFSSLKRYVDPETYKDLPHEFYIYLPDGTKHTYEIFSGNRCKYNSVVYRYSFATTQEIVEYQRILLSSSEIDTGMSVDPSRRTVTLSTCSDWGSKRGNRVVLVGMEKEVKQTQEPAFWYLEGVDD